MNGSTQTENILDLMVETLRPVTQSIVQTVAVERDLDEDTQTLVTDTTLQVIRYLGKRFNVALQSITEHSSKEDVLSSLGCVLPPIIDKGLNIIRTEAFSAASDPLATLTTHEVTEVVTGALSGKDTAEPVKEPHVSLPGKICATIRYVLQMLKVKLQSLCRCCPPTAKIGTPQTPLKVVSVNSDSEEDETQTSASGVTSSSSSSGGQETSEESTSGGDEAAQAVEASGKSFSYGSCVIEVFKSIALMIVISKLLVRLANKVGFAMTADQIEIRGGLLFDKIEALMEAEHVDFNDEALQHLDKRVYKDLCKKRNKNTVFELLVSGTSVEDYIAHTFIKHMTKPPKKGSKICRCLSICKHFRK
uniref:uncharacterized protein LOC109953470 n=1 Tax=Monopterus albus TaxID=43700 RepID=UPI0009B35CF5|nr:uncharacterized protein LOC109953470 [Monopterus albus]